MVKRFIAGAVCPRCGLMDKLMVDSDVQLRECINCGFQDPRPQQVVSEPATRVNRPAARLVETPAEPVHFADLAQEQDED